MQRSRFVEPGKVGEKFSITSVWVNSMLGGRRSQAQESSARSRLTGEQVVGVLRTSNISDAKRVQGTRLYGYVEAVKIFLLPTTKARREARAYPAVGRQG